MAKGDVEIIDDDRLQKKLEKEMKRLDGSFVTIGVHNDAGAYETGEDVAMVAFWNEFGTSKIPERPFMRSAIDTGKAKLDKAREKWSLDMITGKATTEKALNAVGFMIREMIRARINKSGEWAEPNAPTTAEAKLKGGAIRGATPLIRTGLLLRSIEYRVKLK